jgi:hypothetical protein
MPDDHRRAKYHICIVENSTFYTFLFLRRPWAAVTVIGIPPVFLLIDRSFLVDGEAHPKSTTQVPQPGPA